MNKKTQTPIEDMQIRLGSTQKARRYMLADGAPANVIPAKHLRKLIWLSQRLGLKLFGNEYGTAESRRMVAEYYLGDRDGTLVRPLAEAINSTIDEIGTYRLADVELNELVLAAS